jgi:hypothetical protein
MQEAPLNNKNGKNMAVILGAQIAPKFATGQIGVQAYRAAPLLESTAKPYTISPDMPCSQYAKPDQAWAWCLIKCFLTLFKGDPL